VLLNKGFIGEPSLAEAADLMIDSGISEAFMNTTHKINRFMPVYRMILPC
jgi:hypothetical protein